MPFTLFVHVIFRLALLYAFNRSNEFHSTPKLDVSGVPGHLELNGTEEGEEVWTKKCSLTHLINITSVVHVGLDQN